MRSVSKLPMGYNGGGWCGAEKKGAQAKRLAQQQCLAVAVHCSMLLLQHNARGSAAAAVAASGIAVQHIAAAAQCKAAAVNWRE